MNDATKTDILDLLRQGLGLLEAMKAGRKGQLASLVREDAAAIEKQNGKQERSLAKFRAWQQRLKTALPGIPLSRFSERLQGAERAEFQSLLVELQEAILANRSTAAPLYRYLQTSLCFTRGLLESVREDSPGYDRAGHLRSSGSSHKQVAFDL